jgi:hypothetical protein
MQAATTRVATTQAATTQAATTTKQLADRILLVTRCAQERVLRQRFSSIPAGKAFGANRNSPEAALEEAMKSLEEDDLTSLHDIVGKLIDTLRRQ